MAIFAIIPQPNPNNSRLSAAIAAAYPVHFVLPADAGWLVATQGSARQISEAVGIIPGGKNGSGLVLEVASYFGRANAEIWNWIKTNWEAEP